MPHSIGRPLITTRCAHRCAYRYALPLLAVGCALHAQGQGLGQSQIPAEPAATICASGCAVPVERAKPPVKLQGALTAVVSSGPDYLGAAGRGLSIEPGFFLRYGRWTLSSNGSFAAPPNNDYPSGLGLSLFDDDQASVRLSLRVDSGRRSKGVAALRGIDDVPRTVRLRLSSQWAIADGWSLYPGINIDLLGKGVGQTAELRLQRDWSLTPRLRWSLSAGTVWGSRSYLQSYFGVTPAESTASGYALYNPGSGLRDVSLGTGLRYELNPRWVFTASTSVQHLVGPAADSPLTRRTTNWGASAGVGWRF